MIEKGVTSQLTLVVDISYSYILVILLAQSKILGHTVDFMSTLCSLI